MNRRELFRRAGLAAAAPAIGTGLSSKEAVAAPATAEMSGDAFVRFDPASTSWTCGTSVIEQRLELKDGRFLLASLRNRLTGTEFVAGADSDEFRFVFGGGERSGRTGGYKLRDYRISRLPVPRTASGIDPGLSLAINLEHPLFVLTLQYDIFASTPRTPLAMIRKVYRIVNRTRQTQELTNISMNRLRLKDKLSRALTLYYWQGGGAGQGTNSLKIEPLGRQTNRTLNSWAGAPGFRADDVYSGSCSYHPYFVLEEPKDGEGIFLGFNYLGPWSAQVWNPGNYVNRPDFLVGTQIELHTEPLAPGKPFETPNSFIGVYKGDLDSANEQMQDWQATFKWDYTREQYLWGGAIHNGHWNDNAHKQRTDLHTQEMWRIADLCRRTGAHIAHEDDFWFDERGRGVWEGIDWNELVRYLGQSGIRFRLWMPPQHYAPGTPVDVEHPDWALVPKVPDGITGWYGLGFCAAARGAHDYMRRFMLDRQQRYGAFYYRLDGWVQAPCFATNHDHPQGQPHVQQYRHFMEMLREVKTGNPEMGLQGCNSGGEWCNWDKFELLENNQGSDGGGPDDTYYLSYFWPYTKLISANGGSSTRLNTEAAVEQMAADILFERYLRDQGVIGRYMRIYHPRAEGARNEHAYLQMTNSDRTKAAILQDAAPEGEVVVYPKSLAPAARYSVAFRFGKESFSADGTELMARGIRFSTRERNEAVLLNLDSAPGRGTDRTPPTAPSKAVKNTATWGGRNGVELRWPASQDNVIVAGYEVFRDGKLLDRVRIGTFYFDAAADASMERGYEIAAVDGDGNRSPAVAAVVQK